MTSVDYTTLSYENWIWERVLMEGIFNIEAFTPHGWLLFEVLISAKTIMCIYVPHAVVL